MKSTEQNVSTQELATKKKQRRALIGAISTAGVVGAAKLPSQWTRPIVDQVLLPSHAVTTDDSDSSGATSTSSFITTVTKNCVVTCAEGIMNFYTTSYVTFNTNSAIVSEYNAGSQRQCIDSLGGMTSTALGTSTFYSYTIPAHQTTNSWYDDYFCSWGSSTSNAICTVTQTSS